MIRTEVYKIYKSSKESATYAEAWKRIVNECIHGLMRETMKATTLRALKFSTSMDGSLREQLNKMCSKILAILHATLADIFMEIEGNDNGEVPYFIKNTLIGLEREILCLAQNTDFLRYVMKTVECKVIMEEELD